jgi:tetratricopeptide (TPR) repeat protein
MNAMAGTSNGLHWFELIVSWPGAVIVASLALLVIVLVVIFVAKFNVVSLSARDYKIELRKSEALSPPGAIVATPVESQAQDLTTKDADLLPNNPQTNSSLERVIRFYRETSEAIRRQDRSRIRQLYEEYKDEQPLCGLDNYEVLLSKNRDLLQAGDQLAIQELENLESQFSKRADASRALADYWLRIKGYDRARVHIERAEKQAQDDGDLVQGFLLSAQLIDSTEGRMRSISYLCSVLPKIRQSRGISILYAAIGDRHREENRTGLALADYELALKHDPHNKDARFNAAYLYGQEGGLESLALRHYSILLEQDRQNTLALNNVGVLYGQFGMPISQVSAWRDAAEKGNGHAIGNLANAYLNAGFYTEARDLLQASPGAAKDEEPFLRAQSQLQHRDRSEREKSNRLLENAETIWTEIAGWDLTANPTEEDLVGTWLQVDGSAALEVSKTDQLCGIEQYDGKEKINGYTRELTGVSPVSVKREKKGKPQNIGILNTILGSSLLSSGPSDAGHFIVLFGPQGVRVLHVDGSDTYKMIARRDFKKVEKIASKGDAEGESPPKVR